MQSSTIIVLVCLVVVVASVQYEQLADEHNVDTNIESQNTPLHERSARTKRGLLLLKKKLILGMKITFFLVLLWDFNYKMCCPATALIHFKSRNFNINTKNLFIYKILFRELPSKTNIYCINKHCIHSQLFVYGFINCA